MAIPSKGAMAREAQELARDLGFSNGVDGREYLISSSGGKRRFLLARAKDIPAYVESGVADIGITGKDLVAELAPEVEELMQLPFGNCRLVYAVSKEDIGIIPRRVATAFPNIAAQFLSSRGIDAQIISLRGAVEASVASGIADAIIDLSSSGSTLEANGLQEREEILKSSAVVIANSDSLKTKRAGIEEAVSILRGELKIFTGGICDISEGERKRLLYRGRSNSEEVIQTVRGVFDSLEKGRDDSLCSFAEKFDGVKLEPRLLEVSAQEVKEAYSSAGEEVIVAMRKSAENIERFAEKELPQRWELKVEGGFMGKRIVPLDSVGVYAPGGTAAYPSSVLMGVIPARVAGVGQIILCTPCNRERKCNPAVLVAADIAGATRIFKLGGSQAIAAMALGTRTVPRVGKIVGPGNAFVAAAKLEAVSRGLCSIDSPAGPSEIIVIADQSANPAFVASDLLAQAEHGVDAAAILISTSRELVECVRGELAKQVALLPRREIIRKSLASNGALLFAKDLDEAFAFSNDYAPEHLSVMVEKPFAWIEKVRNASSVFAGSYSCVAAGDYSAGPNHVLPTGGAAKSYSGLSSRDFVREVNYLKLERGGLAAMAPSICALAGTEGLQAHANSVAKRFEND